MILAALAIIAASLAVSVWAITPPKRSKPNILQLRIEYERARRRHRGQREAYERLRDAVNEQMRSAL